MPQYLAPGVYVEEIDAGPVQIQGVSTSITGAVGVTVQGPTSGKPVLVTSFAEFQRTFGGFLPVPPPALRNRWLLDALEGGNWWRFPLSVKGFFDNGGQQLYVKRVFAGGPGGATGASMQLGQGLVADVAQDANATATTIKLSHLIDVVVGKQLNFFAADKSILGNPFTVASYNSTQNTVTLDKPTGSPLKAGRDYAVIEGRSDNVTLRFTAKALGDWGNNLSVRVAPMVGGTFNILPDPATGGHSSATLLTADAAAAAGTITVADISGFQNGDHARISGQEYTLSNVSAAFTTQLSAAATAQASTINVADPSGFRNGDSANISGHNYALAIFSTQLSADAAAGTITVDDASGFANGDHASISGHDYTLANVIVQARTIDVNPALVAPAPRGTDVIRTRVGINPALQAAVAASTSVVRAARADVAPRLLTALPAGTSITRMRSANPIAFMTHLTQGGRLE
jgi:phage tail sheath protein FI